ncbi:MAG TPA: germination protein YpeB [Clostridia bacterium]
MKIREKLLDLKRRLSDRKMYSIVIVAIGAVALWGFYQYKSSMELRQRLDNQYNRSFFDMVGYVENVESLLSKAMITSTPQRTASVLQEAWRQANMAQNDLGQLPISQQVLSNTSKFLSQVGDLSYSLNNQNINGKQLSEEQYKMLDELEGFSVSLHKSLTDLKNQITSGRIKWSELANKGTPLFKKASKDIPDKQFESMDKTFQKYPALIYDGPFSDHLTDSPPKGVTGNELNKDEAKNTVYSFFGAEKIKSVSYVGENNSTQMKAYSYRVTFKDMPDDQSADIDITKKGGHVLWMLYNRPVQKSSLGIEELKSYGKKFLESRGYWNMKDTYFLQEDNTAVINYAYVQDKTVVYPDLIKVKIAMDNGEVTGFEAKAYLASHTVREIPKPKITEAEARAKISPRVKLLSSGLAIIPTEYKTEIFTYELKGKLNDKDFLVYINAENGREENILMIVNTPNGVLTI